jgi:hypothetical protein
MNIKKVAIIGGIAGAVGGLIYYFTKKNPEAQMEANLVDNHILQEAYDTLYGSGQQLQADALLLEADQADVQEALLAGDYVTAGGLAVMHQEATVTSMSDEQVTDYVQKLRESAAKTRQEIADYENLASLVESKYGIHYAFGQNPVNYAHEVYLANKDSIPSEEVVSYQEAIEAFMAANLGTYQKVWPGFSPTVLEVLETQEALPEVAVEETHGTSVVGDSDSGQETRIFYDKGHSTRTYTKKSYSKKTGTTTTKEPKKVEHYEGPGYSFTAVTY